MPQLQLLFNELCIKYDETRLIKSLDHAKLWIQGLSTLLTFLHRYKNADELRVPIDFRKTELISSYSLGRLLSDDENIIGKDERDNIKTFTDRGRYLEDISEIVDDAGIFEHRQDVYFFQYNGSITRGFGAAHLLNGLALSIETEEEWNCTSVRIEKHQNSGVSFINVNHACKFEHIGIARRNFERNPKHDVEYDSVIDYGRISQLDLSDEEAQEILDRAAKHDKEKRLYGYSKRTEKFYAFPCHLEGVYHAYPVRVNEIQYRKQILRQLMDVDMIAHETYRRYLKGN